MAAIEQVNLADPSSDPSDFALSSLMSDSMRGVKARADDSRAKLMKDLQQKIAAKPRIVRPRHG